MGLFSRRRIEEAVAPEGPVTQAPPTSEGPWDVEDQPELGARVDLGALRIPARPGLQLRVELDRATSLPIGVTLGLAGSAMQLQVFAAPRTRSLWDEVRPELARSVTDRQGTCDDVPGVFGRELIARLPVTTPGGTGTRAVRYIGVDGPRWMVRGVITGPAALGRDEAKALEDVLRGTVVVRGREARPPRETLVLTLPGATRPVAPQPGGELGVPERGPEMTETR